MSSLEVIETKVDALSQGQVETQRSIRDIDSCIRGDGLGEPGLSSRVSQLETFHLELRRLFRWVAAGIVGLFTNLLWEVVSHWPQA